MKVIGFVECGSGAHSDSLRAVEYSEESPHARGQQCQSLTGLGELRLATFAE